MKALVLRELKQPLRLEERPELQPAAGEVVVQLAAAALNRRDYWITQGLYPGVRLPVVLGSDGAGTVVAVGAGVDEGWVGRRVIINPGFDWGDDPAVQSDRFTILGMPRDGTFADQVAVPVEQLHAWPEHLDAVHAAALPLAGLTAYRAVFTQGGLKSGQRVLITGIGGGVATFALQFARAAGAEVWVTSSSDAKIERAVQLGAAGGINYRQENWADELQNRAGRPQLIIDSAAGPGFNQLLQVVAPGGRIVNFGGTAGPPPTLDIFKLFWKQIRIQGTTMGSPDDFRRMLEFVNEHALGPVIDQVFPLEEGNAALERMAAAQQLGKIVLQISR